jgi:hypothetical protein
VRRKALGPPHLGVVIDAWHRSLRNGRLPHGQRREQKCTEARAGGLHAGYRAMANLMALPSFIGSDQLFIQFW